MWQFHTLFSYIFNLPIGQVKFEIHLPEDHFHLFRAMGQPLTSSPVYEKCITISTWKLHCTWNIPVLENERKHIFTHIFMSIPQQFHLATTTTHYNCWYKYAWYKVQESWLARIHQVGGTKCHHQANTVSWKYWYAIKNIIISKFVFKILSRNFLIFSIFNKNAVRYTLSVFGSNIIVF